MPVAEVQAEQLGVVGACEDHARRRAPATRAAHVWLTPNVDRPTPISDRGSGKAEPPGDLAVIEAGRDEGEDALAYSGRVHANICSQARGM
jgi:hypothetical protein